jgi:CDP-diacylglycerol--glycerol-3-phosphate 3-phosphatidyltransferase
MKAVIPPRFIEGFGLQHIKCYIFDEDVIISGANLSKDYFDNRQDRYLKINSLQIGHYFYDLMKSIGKFSFSISNRKLLPPKSWNYLDGNRKFKIQFQKELMELCNKWKKFEINSETSCIVAPALQLKSLGIVQDQDTVTKLLNMASKNHDMTLHLATAYFNLPNIYQRMLFAMKPDGFNILTSAPQVVVF